MKILKNNKGITLTALIITVVILIIIGGTATYTGMNVYESAKEDALVQELQIVQNAVNNMISKGELHTELSTAQNKIGLIGSSHPVRSETLTEYRYLTKDNLKKLGIAGVNQDVLVNFKTGKVYSLKGYNGKYTLNDWNFNIIYSTD